MDFLKNILAHFRKSKNSQIEVIFNDVTIKSITKDKVVPETSNNVINYDSNATSKENIENAKEVDNPEDKFNILGIACNSSDTPKENNENNSQHLSLIEAKYNINNEHTNNLDEKTIDCIKELNSINDDSNATSKENIENAIEVDIPEDDINILGIASNSLDVFTENNNQIYLTKNNNNNEHNLPIKEAECNVNNGHSNKLDEKTINCIKEFDSILGNVQNTNEIVSIDDFYDLFEDLSFDEENPINIDTEESIPVHVINKDDIVKNDADNNPVSDNSHMKTAEIQFENDNINVDRNPTEIDTITEVASMEIDGNNTKSVENSKFNSIDFDNKVYGNHPIQTVSMIVEENMKVISQETSSIKLDMTIKNLIIMKFENTVPIDTHVIPTSNEIDIKDGIVISADIKDDNNIKPPLIDIDNNTAGDSHLISSAMQIDHHITSMNVSDIDSNDTKEIYSNVAVTAKYELENNKELIRTGLIANKVDSKNIQVDNKTIKIIQQDINHIFPQTNIDHNKNTSDSKEVTLTSVDNNTKLDNNTVTNKSIRDDVEENSEIISISSDEIIDLDDTMSDCGYHSSDFEFISEKEAKLDGFIINYKPNKKSLKPVEGNQINVEHKNIEICPKTPDNNSFKTPKIIDANQPGPSGLTNYESYRNRYARPVLIDRTYRDRHAVPDEEGYLDLFRGMHDPLVYSMENKSTRTNRSMLVEFEGIGFERHLVGRRRDSSEDEYEDEAVETAKKIQDMYPEANRKRRRRF